MSLLVHIFADTPHHYHPMKSFFTEQCSIDAQQVFLVKADVTTKSLASIKTPLDSEQSLSLNQPGSVKNTRNLIKVYQTNDELFSYLAKLASTDRVLFHGLFDLHIWRKLVLLPIAKRCSCVIWGAELYRHSYANRSFKQHVAQWIHIALINRFSKVFTLTPGDGELVNRYLKRKRVSVLPYPLIGMSVPPCIVASENKDSKIKILVGNSAAASNEHLYALTQLAHFSDENVEIIVPLNYAGTDEYVQTVIAKGKEIFGDKFTAITDMLAKSAYDELLASVDLTVFAHERQQGLYVAYAMLLMGKPMFLRSTTSSYANLASLGFDINAVDTLATLSFERLTTMVTTANIDNQNLMNEHFTEQALAPKWSLTLNNLMQ